MMHLGLPSRWSFILLCLGCLLAICGEHGHAEHVHHLRHQGRRVSRQIKEDPSETEVAAAQEKTGLQCEGSPLTIICPVGHRIKVKRANYGRTSLEFCNDNDILGWRTDCISPRAVGIVSRRCDGQTECKIRATNRVFGDPCQLTRKYLEVRYQCIYVAAPTTMGPTEAPSTVAMTTEAEMQEATTAQEDTTVDELVTIEEAKPTKASTKFSTKKLTSTASTGDGGAKFCPAMTVRGIAWPKTPAGLTREALCPNNQLGSAKWMCERIAGYWAPQGPDLSECVSPVITDMRKKLQGGDKVEYIAEEMANVTKEQVFMANDVLATSDLMRDVLIKMDEQIQYDDKPTRTRTVHRVTDAMVKTGSNMLSKDKVPSWRDLPQEEQAKVATSLMDTVEFSAIKLSETVDEPKIMPIIDINIKIEVNIIRASPPVIPDVYYPRIDVKITTPEELAARRQAQIRIPGKAIKDQAGSDELARLVFITYNNIDELLTPVVHNFHEDQFYDGRNSNSVEPKDHETYDRKPHNKPKDKPTTQRNDNDYNKQWEDEGIQIHHHPDETYQGDAGYFYRNSIEDDVNQIQTIVNSKVISASINGRRETVQLKEPLTYTLAHINTTNVENPTCSFWNYSMKTYEGHWSDHGCWVESSNTTHTTCQCNHLTNFAVLMDVVGTKLPEGHKLGLQVITYVGCIISIICLALSFITFVYFKNMQCDRNTIHKNLVLCLFLGEIIFLVGIDKVGHRVWCGIIAGMLHYIFLAAFAWMCLEGIQLYVMLIEVFEAEKSRRVYYYLSAYGLPLIIVGISAAVDYNSYGTKEYCWLRADNGFIWAFVGPVIGVITLNVIMLSIAIYMMCKHAASMANVKKEKEKSRLDNASTYSYAWSWIKGASVLIVLLGLTWAFGLLYLNEHTIAMAYIFTILNSLQGLFIFCFHCLMNEKVQKEYKRCVRHTTWLPMCLRVKYGGYKSYPGSTSPQSTSSGNRFSVQYFQKLLSGRRRKRSSTSSLQTKTTGTTAPCKNWQYQNMKDENNIKGSRSSRISDPASSRLSDPLADEKISGKDDSLEKKGSLEKDSLQKKRRIMDVNGHMTITIDNSLVDDHGYPDEGIQGDLSVIDASVIDSEAVTEYCKGGLDDGYLFPVETQPLVQASSPDADLPPENFYEEVDTGKKPENQNKKEGDQKPGENQSHTVEINQCDPKTGEEPVYVNQPPDGLDEPFNVAKYQIDPEKVNSNKRPAPKGDSPVLGSKGGHNYENVPMKDGDTDSKTDCNQSGVDILETPGDADTDTLNTPLDIDDTETSVNTPLLSEAETSADNVLKNAEEGLLTKEQGDNVSDSESVVSDCQSVHSDRSETSLQGGPALSQTSLGAETPGDIYMTLTPAEVDETAPERLEQALLQEEEQVAIATGDGNVEPLEPKVEDETVSIHL